jgi:hypothetical protein
MHVLQPIVSIPLDTKTASGLKKLFFMLIIVSRSFSRNSINHIFNQWKYNIKGKCLHLIGADHKPMVSHEAHDSAKSRVPASPYICPLFLLHSPPPHIFTFKASLGKPFLLPCSLLITMRSGMFHCEDHYNEPHFLEACFLCRKPLGLNSDIFMYRLACLFLIPFTVSDI